VRSGSFSALAARSSIGVGPAVSQATFGSSSVLQAALSAVIEPGCVGNSGRLY
jgi:hypothetical protein